MKNPQEIKAYVKEHYGEAAKQSQSCCGGSSCCGSTKGKDPITKDLYQATELEGIPDQALLASLGCANPTAVAELKSGETVLDLGSGGGIDVLLSAKRVGPTGKAYGLDMTDEMLSLARKNAERAGATNVEFLKGEIENIPLPDNSVNVIISNCVINLSPDKDSVLKEAFRVLKPGGRFAVADIVIRGELPEALRKHLELWAGCIAGALTEEEYLEKLTAAGFEKAEIEVARTYTKEEAKDLLPAEVYAEMEASQSEEITGSIISAFIRAQKPSPKCCCCGG